MSALFVECWTYPGNCMCQVSTLRTQRDLKTNVELSIRGVVTNPLLFSRQNLEITIKISPSKRPQRWRFRLVFQRNPLRNPGRCSNYPKWRREREVLEVKPVPVSFIPPQNPHTLAWDWSPSIPGEMTAWITTRPASTLLLHCSYEQKKKIVMPVRISENVQYGTLLRNHQQHW